MAETFLTQYMKKSLSTMQVLFPNLTKEELVQRIKEIVKENMNYRKDLRMDGDGFPTSLSVRDIDNFIAQREPIIDGHGTLFKKHHEQKNILGDMCDEFMIKRKVYKKEMFKHINDEDKTLCNNFDMLQRNMKILNNSFYGATNEPNSIFYNPLFGPSITYQGEDIIMTAVNAFECFLSNNFSFKTTSDALNYMDNIMNEEYTCENIEIINPPSFEEVYEYFINKIEIKEDLVLISLYLKNHQNKDVLSRVYFKNNLVEFFERSNILDNLFDKVVGREDFLDPNEPPEDMIEIMDDIWNILNDYVFYNYQNFYKFYNCHNRKRKTVLTVNLSAVIKLL